MRRFELPRQREAIDGLVCKIGVAAYAMRDRDFVGHSGVVRGMIMLVDWLVVVILENCKRVLGVISRKHRLAR